MEWLFLAAACATLVIGLACVTCPRCVQRKAMRCYEQNRRWLRTRWMKTHMESSTYVGELRLCGVAFLVFAGVSLAFFLKGLR